MTAGWPIRIVLIERRRTVTDEEEMEYAAAAMHALREHGVPLDTIEMLLRGSKRQGIPPGAIVEVVKAIVAQIKMHPRSDF